MKKLIVLLSIFLMLTMLIPVKQAQAHGGGWFLPGLIIGGVLGWGLAAPHYYYYPRYYYPPPAYYYPPPAYYYPPPAPTPAPETVYPPQSEASQAPSSGGRLFIYPRQGQSLQKQEEDRLKCHDWAVNQTGFDPSTPPGSAPDSQAIQKSADYFRAMSACMDARGYTVR
jgi:hypothetical protein